MWCLVQKREVVDRQYHGHAVVEGEVFRHLVGDVPEIDPAGRQEGTDQRSKRPQCKLLLPWGDSDPVKATLGEVPVGSRRQKEDRLEPAGGDPQQFLGQVQRKPPQATVDVPEFLEVDDDAGQAVGHVRAGWGK